MPLFRTKNRVAEANQFTGSEESAKALGLTPVAEHYGDVPMCRFDGSDGNIHLVAEGDWVVIGLRGERYPVKGEIFNESYEPVEQRARNVQVVEVPILQFTRTNQMQQALDDAWVVIHVMHQAGKEVLSNSQHFREVLSNAERSLSNTQC